MVQPLVAAVFESPRYLALQDEVEKAAGVNVAAAKSHKKATRATSSTRETAIPRFNVLDCTLGGGTHSEAILEYAAPYSRVVALDCDAGSAQPIATSLQRRYGAQRFRYFSHRYSQLCTLVPAQSFDAVLVDPGPTHSQLADPTRGFGTDEEDAGVLLDMRYGRQWGAGALQVLNTAPEPYLWDCVAVLGDFPNLLARRLVQAIVHARPIESVGHLFAVIERNGCSMGEARDCWEAPVFKRFTQIAPCARFMHALRALVNNEREELREVIRAAAEVLAPDGRLVIFTRLPFERVEVEQAAVTHPYLLRSFTVPIELQEAEECGQARETTMHVLERTRRACFDVKNLALDDERRVEEKEAFFNESALRFTYGINDAIQSRQYPARNFSSGSLFPTAEERARIRRNNDPPPVTALRGLRTRIPRQ